MKYSRHLLVACLGVSIFCALLNAQQPSASASSAVVPRLVNFSGRAADTQGKIITGIAGATFAIYTEEYEGSPLWLETQNIQADAKGNYTVQLGATKPEGLPLDLFTSGEARWLGVTINNGSEQPRILLLSVPYALKAADAETIGGLPPSAFVLAAQPKGSNGSEPAAVGVPTGAPATSASAATGAAAAGAAAPAAKHSPATSSDVTTTGGTVNTIPLFTTATNVQNSLLTQTGKTAVNVAGKLNLFALGTATASKAFNSQPQDFVASAFNSSTGKAVPQTFQLQAEPVNNDTSLASGSLNLLYASGTGTPAETGLSISSTGFITVNDTSTTSPASPLTAITTGTSAPAVLGLSNVTNGAGSVGVEGSTSDVSPASYGVFGRAGGNEGSPIGVFGKVEDTNSTGDGVFGEYGSESKTGISYFGEFGVGVWGDGGSGSPGSAGVVGTIDNGNAAIFANNSDSPTVVTTNNGAGELLFAYNSNGSCFITGGTPSFECSGDEGALVSVDGGQRTVAMSAIESPVNWFEDAGSAKLVNGVAVVELDPTFTQTVNSTMDYKVFPVPNGDCKGLYVTNKTATSFEVHELGGGASSIAFDYRVMAVRQNYENVRFADRTHDMDSMKRMQQRMNRTGAKPQSHDPDKKLLSPPAKQASLTPAAAKQTNGMN
jgi:hypothetical protein